MSPRLSHLLRLLSNGTRPPAGTPGPTEAPYDHRGALWYVVTVVSVYAMAIVFMIVSHINRRTEKRELDREVSAFLRSAPTVRVEEERQRRRNLKRAMQPFIRLALDRRTVGVHVSPAADWTEDLLTQPSIETLTDRSVELLPVSDRVIKSSGRSRRRRLSSLSQHHQQRQSRPSSRASTAAASTESGWHSSGSADDVAVLGGRTNDKWVQCSLDPRQTLANRSRRRLLRPVPSETELGASASSHQMMLMRQEQQLQTSAAGPSGIRPLQLELDDDPTDRRLRVSAAQTHVPRFLAVGSVPARGRQIVV